MHPAIDFPITPGTLSAAEIKTLVGKDDPVILDVGANSGQTTAAILAAIPGATIYAFEPDPRAIAKFRNAIRSPRVQLFECAVGAVNGTVTFHQSAGEEQSPDYALGWDQSGSIRKPKTHLQVWPRIRFEKQIEVAITTLDTWSEQHGISGADFIWADVQGAESDLIDGATRFLGAVPWLYTEYSNLEEYTGQITLSQLANKLKGFDLTRRYHMDALFKKRQSR